MHSRPIVNFVAYFSERNIAVLGAGLMGAGIASVSIDKGYQVILKDMTQGGLTRGFNQIAKTLKDGVKRKKFTQ